MTSNEVNANGFQERVNHFDDEEKFKENKDVNILSSRSSKPVRIKVDSCEHSILKDTQGSITVKTNGSGSQRPVSSKRRSSSIRRQEKYHIAPEGGFGWLVVFCSFTVHFLLDGFTYAFGSLVSDIIDNYDTTREVIGWLVSILVGLTMGIGPVASILSRRWGFRAVGFLGSICGGLGIAAPFFVANLGFLFTFASVIAGIGFGLVYLPSICIVGLYFEKRQSLAIGFAVCGSGVGTFVFGPLLEALCARYSWRGALLISGGLLLNCAVCACFYRPLRDIEIEISEAETSNKLPASSRTTLNQLDDELPEKINELDRDCSQVNIENLPYEKNASKGDIEESKNVDVEFCNVKPKNSILDKIIHVINLKLLLDPMFSMFAWSNFLTSLGFNAPYLYAADRAELMGQPKDKASFLISSIGIGNTVGRIVFGAISSHRSDRDRVHIYNMSLVLAGLVTGLSCFATNYIGMIAYTAGFGLLTGTYVTLTSVVLVDLLGNQCLSDSFGLTMLFQGVAVLVGPPFAGFIYDKTQSHDISFAVCGLFLSISGVMLYPLFCMKWRGPSAVKRRENITNIKSTTYATNRESTQCTKF